jgi:flagellar hook-associated protein 3 FlgL
MPLTSLGDMAQHFALRRQNFDLKSRLDRLGRELSTGRHADPAVRVGPDLAILSDLDRRIARAEALSRGAQDTGNLLATLQTALASIETRRSGLVETVIALGPAPSGSQVDVAAHAARDTLDGIAAALNVRLGNTTLLAGRATDGPAMADGATILDTLRTATAGAATAADVATALDAAFAPGGVFDNLLYRGDTGGTFARPVDDGGPQEFSLRADATVFRDLLRATALAALAGTGETALDLPARRGLLELAIGGLISAADGLAAARGRIGLAEQRAEEARVRHGAEMTALGIMRNERLAADPFETAAALQSVQVQLETHYEVTARLSRMTLAAFLR